MQIKRRTFPETLPDLHVEHPILKRIFAARGIDSNTQLEKTLNTLHPYTDLLDIDKAVQRLESALANQERLLIVGDFDADGATSSSLAVSALKAMGAEHVHYLVPNRFEFGYGLTPAIVDVAQEFKPNLIITVDNGIASLDGVARANEKGIDVIITDHHLPGERLPDACAIVNPNRQGCPFPSKSIAGVGVIFYVMLALRRALSNHGWFSRQGLSEPNMAQFLDLVALGTVADVVGLDQNNRTLVRQGLLRIRQGACRPGIKALIEVSGRNVSRLRESDLGFAVAPRLNAAGRLDDMSLGIECLLSTQEDQAKLHALQLDQLNKDRRQIESEMKAQALNALTRLSEKVSDKSENLPPVLCLVDPAWHQGVIGILAGRLKEKFHRPAIIFAEVSDTELKGSARSISGLNIRDVLAAIDKDHPGLITKFGGHAMAAGLSMPPSSFATFQKALIDEVAKQTEPSDFQAQIITDGPLEALDLSLELAILLNEAGPWGQQFPEPLFDNVFELLDQRLVGERHLKLTLQHEEGGQPLDAIAFNVDLNTWPNYRAQAIHAAYRLDINEYNGRTKLQLIIETMRAL